MSGFESNRFINLSESMEKHLICSICLNIYNNGVKSECEHTFCKSCVQNSIENNHKECPICRTEFTRKRTTSVTMGSNFVIVSNFIFKYNLMANNMINELIIKCDYQSNGCQVVIELGSLSTHLKNCEHWLCPKCEFIGRSEGHDCLEFLKKDRNQLKVKLNEIEAKNSLLEEKAKNNEKKFNEMINKMKKIRGKNSILQEEIKTFKRSEVRANNRLRDIKPKLKSSEIINRFEKELNEIKSKNLLLETNFFKINLSIDQETTLTVQSIYLGTYLSLYSKFDFNSYSFCFETESKNCPNFSIGLKLIEEIKFCIKFSFSVIILKPNNQRCDEIRKFTQLTEPSKGWFNVGSEDPKERYIMIKFCPQINLKAFNIKYLLNNLPLLSTEIDSNEAQRMFSAVSEH